MTPQLDNNIYEHVKLLCANGDSLADRKEFNLALEKYQEALRLVPEPSFKWEASTWIFTAIGDAHFLSGNFNEAYSAFSSAAACPGGIGNPFIHLRLGEIQFELGNELLAADELARAYMSAGKNIFAGEPEKYFSLLKKKLRMPEGDSEYGN